MMKRESSQLSTNRHVVMAGLVMLFFVLHSPSPAATSPKEVFTLIRAIETALGHNIDMLQGKNQVAAKEVGVDQKKAQFYPDLGASGQVSRQTGEALNIDSGQYENQSITGFSATVTSRLNLFNGFYNTSALKQAKAELTATRRDICRLRENIIYETITRYIQVIAAEELVRVEEKNLEAQREQLKLISAFHSAGRRPLADLYLQQAETAQAEFRLLNAQRTVRVNTHLLLEFMGLDPGTPCRFSKPTIDDGKPEPPRTGGANRRVTESLASRQDYLAMTGWLEAAREGIRSAQSGYWPTLDLTLNAGTSYNSLSDEPYSFSQQVWENNPYASIGLILSLPIYDRSATRTQVALARIALENEQLAAEKIKLQIGTEVRQALEDFQTSQKELDVAESQRKYSRQSLNSYEERYRVNAATLAELSLARSQQLQADYDWVIARYTLFLRRVALGYFSGDAESMMAAAGAGNPVQNVLINTQNPGGKNEK